MMVNILLRSLDVVSNLATRSCPLRMLGLSTTGLVGRSHHLYARRVEEDQR